MSAKSAPSPGMQRAGALAALYIVLADLAAIPYFVLLVDYPSVTGQADKVALLTEHHTDLYVMHLVSFELVALALIVVNVAMYQRLSAHAPSLAQLALAVGLVQAGLLLASVQTYNSGMNAVVDLHATDPEQASTAWQVIETVAEGLAGSGGQVVAGVWLVLINSAALSAHLLPRGVNWLGVSIGAMGILAAVPALASLEVAFGLLQIVWFAWLAITMMHAGAVSPACTPDTVSR